MKHMMDATGNTQTDNTLTAPKTTPGKETNRILSLEWDSHFFGIPIGRIYADGLGNECLQKELESARERSMRFVELFCDVGEHEAIVSCEGAGFCLADLRISLKQTLQGEINEGGELRGSRFEKAGESDIHRLKAMSRGLFESSRYYRYRDFDRMRADLMFQTWVEKSVRGQFDDEMHCLYRGNDIPAFCSLRYDDQRAAIGLFGINGDYQAKGWGGLLLRRILHLLDQRRVTEVSVVTQGKNIGALRLYQKNGFRVASITLCYYKWLTTPG